MAGKIWTKKELRILKKHYSISTTAVMLNLLPGRSDKSIYMAANIHELKKSKEYLNEMCIKLFKKLTEGGKVSRFKKGLTPWNKGLKGVNIGGIETQFKKGERPKTAHKVGTILTRQKEGDKPYKYIALAGQKMMLYHRYLWEQKNGKIPNGYILACQSNDTLNTELSNWKLLSRSDNMKRNSYLNNYPKDIQLAIQLQGVLSRQINKRIKQISNEK